METPDGPPAYLGGWRPGTGLVRRTRDAVGRSLVRGFKRSVHALYRDRLSSIGFPLLYRRDGSEAVYSDERILAVSLEELEFPRTYPAAVEFVGPILYSPPVDAPDPPFVAGRPHVLVTLGTHLGWHRAKVAAAVHSTARRLPHVEFHLSDGDRNSTRRESLANVHRVGFISYTQHLAKYAAVIHHGGAGVLAHTLAAGTPAVVLPVDFDQFDNAARLAAAGVAIRVKHLRDLPSAVARALDDEDIRAACLRMRAILSAGAAEERIAERVTRHFA
jgi:UDP:flavonoid glycosyltransferase YjiC (YdhE family)